MLDGAHCFQDRFYGMTAALSAGLYTQTACVSKKAFVKLDSVVRKIPLSVNRWGHLWVMVWDKVKPLETGAILFAHMQIVRTFRAKNLSSMVKRATRIKK